MSRATITISAARRALCDVRPRTADELHGWVRAVLGFDVPRRPRLPGNAAPFDYLRHAFFEDSQPRDCVVWAGRGTGKTRLGAVATLLDLIFKPGIQVRILGGSLDQSAKMHAYLREMLGRDEFAHLLDGRATGRRIALTNGSLVEILAQSEPSVRGQRVQKLRCDEVELFTEEVWQAAQFVTRSAWCGEVFVPGCVEALSTMHRPFGFMSRLVADRSRRTFRWSVVDVLEHCPVSRECDSCKLWDDCQGRAKRGRGFFLIEDAIQQSGRTGGPEWAAEMMCVRPSRSACVYPMFEEAMHVREFVGDREAASAGPEGKTGREAASGGMWVAGMDFGYRAPTVVLWAHVGAGGIVHVVDEHVATEMTTERHIEVLRARRAVTWIGIDPAGWQRNEHTGLSNASLMSRAGFIIRSRRAVLHEGVRAVQALLRAADGSVRLFIDPRCTRLIEAMHKYHFPPDKAESLIPVKDGHDHACDALRYLIINLDGEGKRGLVRYA